MPISSNAQSLQTALDYLAKTIQWQLIAYFGMESATNQPDTEATGTTPSQPPGLSDEWFSTDTPLAQFCCTYQLTQDELMVMVIALAPHLQPDFFDQVITAFLPQAGDYPQIGGWRGKSHRGFLPTGDTALFILGAHQLGDRLQSQHFFDEEHLFARKQILTLDAPADGEPRMSGKLIMTQDYIDWFTQGRMSRPRFSLNFPAEAIATDMEWSDLVLNPKTIQQVKVLETWLLHHHRLEQWMAKRKQGYRALFHGPPGR
ncbi:MAG: ATP-binding protein, partial [Merismopedia sp. SIO2A8]|nr:ATP-binding protein [Merismopedia sp. SIO2A8]